MLRQIITYHLALILILTNLGIPVFKHVCHTQEKSWSSVLVPAKSCCSQRKQDSEKILCHIPVHQDNDGINRLPCCENQNDLIQFGASFVQAYKDLKELAFASVHDTHFHSTTFYAIDQFRFSQNAEQLHPPPMLFHGRSLVILYQVFRC